MTILEPRQAYSLLAEDYDSTPNALIALEERTMTPLLPKSMLRINMEGIAVVDVAAGTGRWALCCAKRGARVVAIDFCQEMLRRAPKQPSQLELVQGDAARLPLCDGYADLVICAFALGYAPACFGELARIVRPGGTLLISDIHPDAVSRGWTRSFRHDGEAIQVADHHYTLTSLRAPGLRQVRVLEAHLGLPERSIFEQAGKLGRFEEACRYPAIFIAAFQRS